jgi:hypothetical protein
MGEKNPPTRTLLGAVVARELKDQQQTTQKMAESTQNNMIARSRTQFKNATDSNEPTANVENVAGIKMCQRKAA